MSICRTETALPNAGGCGRRPARRCCFYPPEIWKKTSFAGTIRSRRLCNKAFFHESPSEKGIPDPRAENKEKTVYDDGFLRVDLERGVAERDQEYFQLTPTEQRIVKKFIENRGRLLTYQSLLDALWDEGSQFLDKHTLAVTLTDYAKSWKMNSIHISPMFMGWDIYGNELLFYAAFSR